MPLFIHIHTEVIFNNKLLNHFHDIHFNNFLSLSSATNWSQMCVYYNCSKINNDDTMTPHTQHLFTSDADWANLQLNKTIIGASIYVTCDRPLD